MDNRYSSAGYQEPEIRELGMNCADPETEVKEKYPNRFKPGQSGNPAGRPKLSQEDREVLAKLRSLTPMAYNVLKELLESKSASWYAKLQAVNILFDRVYGRPPASVQVTNVQESREESIAHIRALVSRIRIRTGEDEVYESDE